MYAIRSYYGRLTECTVALAQSPAPKSDLAQRVAAVTEGILLAGYRFDRYRTRDTDKLPPALAKVVLLVAPREDLAPAEASMEKARQALRGVFLARDLVNEPGNVKSPEHLAERAREMAREVGLTCTVLERNNFV